MERQRADETLEPLRGEMRIYQKKRGARFGLDAVLLAAHAGLRQGDRVCDLGTGSGIVPLLLAPRAPAHICGLELQPAYAEMAARSVALNRLGELIDIMQGDLRNIRALMPAGQCSLVTCNPPYHRVGAGRARRDPQHSAAHTEQCCTVDDVCAAAAWLLPAAGRFVTVYRPDRLPDLLEALRRHKLEPKRLRFVHNTPHDAPILLLVQALRGARGGLAVEAPLLLQDPNGGDSEELWHITKGEPAWM